MTIRLFSLMYKTPSDCVHALFNGVGMRLGSTVSFHDRVEVGDLGARYS